ncbi:MAG: prolipoprotein diacylglyceryl transferase [Asticcacaulis sp.]|nr:prolipoprotein diacylglyceryl transferase [Asticcacaulis sp.]
MHLPVVFHIFGLALPVHLVFETLAYGVGFRLYLWLRKQGDRLDDRTRMTALVGAIVGAGLGSKLLGFAEHPELWQPALDNPIYLMAAKTILGGLLGGIIGVETAKAIAGVKASTGDLYVFPLIAAIAIGRIGCLLTGVSDGTWGDATHFILGFDAGDGVVRHPTPLYEIGFLIVLAGVLWQVRARFILQNGDLFKLFIMAYCAWRFLIEFLKPVTTSALTNNLNIVQNIASDSDLSAKPCLSMLQIAATIGFAAYAGHFVRRRSDVRKSVSGFSRKHRDKT